MAISTYIDPSKIWDVTTVHRYQDTDEPLVLVFKFPVTDEMARRPMTASIFPEVQGIVEKETVRRMGTTPYTVRYEWLKSYKDELENHNVVIVKAYISPIRGTIHGLEPVSNHKNRCCWCGGHTKDDEVGNCSACGGPR